MKITSQIRSHEWDRQRSNNRNTLYAIILSFLCSDENFVEASEQILTDKRWTFLRHASIELLTWPLLLQTITCTLTPSGQCANSHEILIENGTSSREIYSLRWIYIQMNLRSSFSNCEPTFILIKNVFTVNSRRKIDAEKMRER